MKNRAWIVVVAFAAASYSCGGGGGGSQDAKEVPVRAAAVADPAEPQAVPAAGVSEAKFTDPPGDPSGAKDDRADIIGVEATEVDGLVTLANPEAPTTRNWIEGDSALLITIYQASGYEYEGNFSSFDDGLYGSIFDEDEKELCKGKVHSAYLADQRYTLTFPTSCVGSPTWLSFAAEMTYDDVASGRGPSEDIAPENYDPCCKLEFS
jgi:hypothetical protein